MENDSKNRKKRKSIEPEEYQPKRSKDKENSFDYSQENKAGKIKRVLVRNFMCHDALEVTLNPHVNFIVGRNGSGKSAVLTALTVGLGARASVTSRGSSTKGFIKKGKQTASIEVTLLNHGPMAYKPDVYGNSITVLRNIGSVSSYKIKNWKGDIISTKRKELDKILKAMNIQIDNPISVLNQDISRTFLVSSKPEEKYELFMKATLLDVIGNNYKQAELMCHEEYEKLKQYNEILSDVRKEVEQLRIKIKRAEEVDTLREEVNSLEGELLWAVAITEEKKLEKHQEISARCEKSLKQLQDTEFSSATRDEEIHNQIRNLEEEIRIAEHQVTDYSETYNKVKQDYGMNKDAQSTKARELRSVQGKLKRLEDDISMIKKEIHRLESGDGGEQNERKEMRQQLATLEQKLDEVVALLKTTQSYQMDLETNKKRLLSEIQTSKNEMIGFENRIQRIKREINARKQHADNALSVFGRNIPRLLRRIDEEYRNGRFKEKPRGPVGAYIKMKDSSWAPAVENFLGAGTFSTFCVDNSQDAKVLNTIMREIYLNEKTPQIICSKFYKNVHDVRAHSAYSPKYPNLLNAMDISDPIVANYLIDQREVECVLLIPTSNEASEIMSDISKVPRNCKQAFTKQADRFYPDPHYRSYGGPRGLKAKFLQVSIVDAISALEEELRTIEVEKDAATQANSAAAEKDKRISSELRVVNMKVAKLHATQNQYKSSINDIKDKLEVNEAMILTEFKNELSELEKKLHKEKSDESRLKEEVGNLELEVRTLEAEVKRFRDIRQNLDLKINPLKENIKELLDEKEATKAESRHAAKKLQTIRQALQNATAELETQQRVTKKAMEIASRHCERINTERSVKELQRLSRDLNAKIHEIEEHFGTIQQLRAELKQKEGKCGKDIYLISKIEKSYKTHFERLENRKAVLRAMKHEYGVKIQNSFSNVLALRNKKGSIKIDHSRKVLELEVSSQNDSRRPTNDARSLSGGERSYSTVAFILALWDCTGLPFYFLDEFDVFMDKVNRRVIMDILLDHTKTHPQSQFTFLTPLDTSHVLAEDYVTIHQLAPPQRTN